MRLMLVFLLLAVLLMTACKETTTPAVAVESGVSIELAAHRAASLTDIHYTLYFDIPRDIKADIHALATIEFELSDNTVPVQLDFAHSSASIKSVRSNGESDQYQFYHEHIVLPASILRLGHNSIEISFTAGSSSLNRNAEYLYTLFVPDRARTAFPVFDQPDLKATYELTLRVPDDWVAMSNAPVNSLKRVGLATHYQFERTQPMSSYLFSFVVGKFETVTRQRNGRSMTMLHRETDAGKVARNLDAVFDLHAAAIEWMEQYTGIDYPYVKFDFALIPSFQYGGMEHVGAIGYRASSLFLDESPSDNQLLSRASLIAHETAHMWFGNLVTMAWFNDVWTKEVFANFMAAKIITPSFPAVDHDLNFVVGHYPSAYSVDRTAGANPIRQALPNLRDAGQMYGSIIYHKAPIMMRQLELLLGPDALRDGLREYLQIHAFSNATWPGLIRILDGKTNTNLENWSHVWVNTPGRPEFSIDIGESGQPQLVQNDPQGEGRVWPQTFSIRHDRPVEPDTLQVQSVSSITPVLGLSMEGSGPLLFNANGLGYGLYPADTRNLADWSRLAPVEKASAMINIYENLLTGSLGSAQEYYLSLLKIIPVESNQLIIQLLLNQLSRIHTSFLGEGQRHQQALESTLWETMLSQTDSSATKMFFDAYASLATTSTEVEKIHQVWAGERRIDKLKLAESDYISLTQTLAIRLPDKAETLISRQLARIENPDNRRKLEFLAPTLSASITTRDAFFNNLAEEENRRTESWVLGALANLHHPSRIKHAEKYIQPSLELLQEIQVTGDIFFPAGWLNMTLRNHRSSASIATVESFLLANPNYNPQLRMKILQAVDLPIRANAIARMD
jgi:aminopeptidase N